MSVKNTGALLFLVLTLITAFSSCVDIVSDSMDPFEIVGGSHTTDRQTVGMAIISKPEKLVYEIDDEPDWTGLKIMETYSDGATGIETDYHLYDIGGFDSSSSGEKTITVAKDGISAPTFRVTVNPPWNPDVDLIALSVSSAPKKLAYEQGESADWTGLAVTETYSDNSARIETNYGNYAISGFDSSSPGEKTITLSKDDLWAMFRVTVNPPLNPETLLVSLYISSPPNKLAYEQGESADWTGLTVTENYSDNSARIETNYDNYDISGFDSSSPGEKIITLSKNDLSAVFTVTVNPPWNPETVLVSLAITSPPNKQLYDLYESADWTGLVVTGTYSDDSSRVETNYDYSYFDNRSPGEKSIIVTKSGIGAPPFTVTVRRLDALSISSPPDKLVYETGASADWTGLVVEGTYFDGTDTVKEIIGRAHYNISGFDSSSPGVKTIAVSSGSIDVTFTVTVDGLVSLTISSRPEKLVYVQGESAEWTGLTVTGKYFLGDQRTETAYEISGFNSSSPGEKTITVSKSGINATFAVTVDGLVSLTISSPPNKVVYMQGASADWAGLVVTGKYFLGDQRTETVYEISGFDSSSLGVKTITVTKNGVSASFTVETLPGGTGDITVVPPPQTGDINLTLTGTTVAAADGYTGYQWYVDDMARPADSDTDGKALTLNTPAYSAGKHRVLITAWKQGLLYSGDITVTLP